MNRWMSGGFLTPWGALVAAAIMAGCAAVPMAPHAESEAAKKLLVPADSAFVYLMRPSVYLPGIAIAVEVNGQPIGAMVVESYFLIEIPPGECKLVSKSQNKAELTINAEAGKRYYVIQHAELGIRTPQSILIAPQDARTAMEVVDDELGQRWLAKMDLIRHVKL